MAALHQRSSSNIETSTVDSSAPRNANFIESMEEEMRRCAEHLERRQSHRAAYWSKERKPNGFAGRPLSSAAFHSSAEIGSRNSSYRSTLPRSFWSDAADQEDRSILSPRVIPPGRKSPHKSPDKNSGNRVFRFTNGYEELYSSGQYHSRHDGVGSPGPPGSYPRGNSAPPEAYPCYGAGSSASSRDMSLNSLQSPQERTPIGAVASRSRRSSTSSSSPPPVPPKPSRSKPKRAKSHTPPPPPPRSPHHTITVSSYCNKPDLQSSMDLPVDPLPPNELAAVTSSESGKELQFPSAEIELPSFPERMSKSLSISVLTNDSTNSSGPERDRLRESSAPPFICSPTPARAACQGPVGSVPVTAESSSGDLGSQDGLNLSLPEVKQISRLSGLDKGYVRRGKKSSRSRAAKVGLTKSVEAPIEKSKVKDELKVSSTPKENGNVKDNRQQDEAIVAKATSSSSKKHRSTLPCSSRSRSRQSSTSIPLAIKSTTEKPQESYVSEDTKQYKPRVISHSMSKDEERPRPLDSLSLADIICDNLKVEDGDRKFIEELMKIVPKENETDNYAAKMDKDKETISQFLKEKNIQKLEEYFHTLVKEHPSGTPHPEATAPASGIYEQEQANSIVPEHRPDESRPDESPTGSQGAKPKPPTPVLYKKLEKKELPYQSIGMVYWYREDNPLDGKVIATGFYIGNGKIVTAAHNFERLVKEKNIRGRVMYFLKCIFPPRDPREATFIPALKNWEDRDKEHYIRYNLSDVKFVNYLSRVLNNIWSADFSSYCDICTAQITWSTSSSSDGSLETRSAGEDMPTHQLPQSLTPLPLELSPKENQTRKWIIIGYGECKDDKPTEARMLEIIADEEYNNIAPPSESQILTVSTGTTVPVVGMSGGPWILISEIENGNMIARGIQSARPYDDKDKTSRSPYITQELLNEINLH